ncbi:FadR family transcriptional regulator [Schaalia meyeri]|uniref:FadR family transcriptional regulator n=1 Tax=Schaalia meyeri TaxID=52773 RepID=A0AAQ0BX11_9ACTO|nr:GntR family transcriptional regulator [Schaalia meyeri]QQC43932.1 FadR family transcriptional regulator [Schaalia meyeri]
MDAIKSYILRHGLRSGDRLPTESALCADLGVSRSSVREALRRLQALDIVTVRQGSGSYVGDMSMQPLVETLVLRAALDEINGVESLHSIVETRHALDLGIALPLTRAMTGTTNPRLWELVDAMATRAREGATYLDQDIAFHSGLLAYLDNALMHQLVAAMWLVHQSVTPQLAAASRQEMEDAADAHAAILRACEAGDPAAYAAAVDAHYAPLLAIIEGR